MLSLRKFRQIVLDARVVIRTTGPNMIGHDKPKHVWEACIDKASCHGRSTLSCEVLNMPITCENYLGGATTVKHPALVPPVLLPRRFSCPLSKAEWVLDGRLYAEIAIPIHLVSHPPLGVRAPRTHWAQPHQPGPSPGRRLDSLDCWTENDFKKGKGYQAQGLFLLFLLLPNTKKV